MDCEAPTTAGAAAPPHDPAGENAPGALKYREELADNINQVGQYKVLKTGRSRG